MSERFMLFAGSHYYPGGGMNDYVRSFDTVEQAISNIGTGWAARNDWMHVLDSKTGEVYNTNLISHSASSICAWAKNIDTHLNEQKI